MTKEKCEYSEQQEAAQYEKLASRTKELIEEARELTSEAVDAAIDKAKEELAAANEFSQEQGERLRGFLRRDLKTTREHAASMKEGLQPQRVAFGIQSAMAGIFARLGDLFQDWADNVEERLSYRTGEVCSPGTLTCDDCGNEVQMTATGRVPPCSNCHATEFRRSY